MAILQLHAILHYFGFAPEQRSDLLLTANHCQQSCFLHEQVVGGGAGDLAQVPSR